MRFSRKHMSILATWSYWQENKLQILGKISYVFRRFPAIASDKSLAATNGLAHVIQHPMLP